MYHVDDFSRGEKIDLIRKNRYCSDGVDLEGMNVRELDNIIRDAEDDSDMYPNGRDYSAEDEDWP